MGSDWIWLIFLVMFFLPFLQQRVLSFNRQRMISQLERKRESRVIAMVHRQETMKLFGFPIMRYIDIQDSEEVLKAIQMTGAEEPIDLVLHTPGGLVLPSLQIARALHEHEGKVTVFVPHYAMSGGTLIALACDEIVLSRHAVLGPVDPQIGGYPAASITNAVKHKPVEDLEDQTLIMEDVSVKAMRQIRLAVERLLGNKLPDEQTRTLARLLSRGTWTHDYPLYAETLQGFGLTVTTEVPEEVYDLMSLYPQPVRQQGGVEYLPSPRQPRPTPPGTDSSTGAV